METARAPLVSIACVTFNHENYIRQTIEGFLSQRTSFPVEILIGDDASTDRTAEIIREYHRRHPDVIVPLLQKENQYSKGKHPLLEGVLPKCRGTYIAICEGDDYWTDPDKLQKQVDFLESHPDYSLVYTDYVIYHQASGVIVSPPAKERPSGSVFEKLMEINFIATLTVLFRKETFDAVELTDIFKQYFLQGDYPLWLEFSQRGKIKYLDSCTSVYRVLPESASHSKCLKKREEIYRSSIRVKKYMADKYGYAGYDEERELQKMYYNLMVCAIEDACYEEARRYSLMVASGTFKTRMIMAGCSVEALFHMMALYSRVRYWFARLLARTSPRLTSFN